MRSWSRSRNSSNHHDVKVHQDDTTTTEYHDSSSEERSLICFHSSLQIMKKQELTMGASRRQVNNNTLEGY